MWNIVTRQRQKRLTTYAIENSGRKNEKYEVKQQVSSVTCPVTYLYGCSSHCFIGVVEKAWKNVKYSIFRENQFLLKQNKKKYSIICARWQILFRFTYLQNQDNNKKGIPKLSQPIRTTMVSWIQSKVHVKPVEKPVKLVQLAMTIIKWNRKCDIIVKPVCLNALPPNPLMRYSCIEHYDANVVMHFTVFHKKTA